MTITKTIYRLLFICTILCCLNCKEKESEKPDTGIVFSNDSNTDNNISVFKVKMKLILKEPTKLQMYYLEKEDEKYSSKKLITQDVEGSNEPQWVVFNIPEHIFPLGLRFDFGEKKEKDIITFVSMAMTYEDFNLNISPQEFNAFFSPNIYIKYSKTDGLINCNIVNDKYDPHFKSSPVLNKRLEIEER